MRRLLIITLMLCACSKEYDLHSHDDGAAGAAGGAAGTTGGGGSTAGASGGGAAGTTGAGGAAGATGAGGAATGAGGAAGTTGAGASGTGAGGRGGAAGTGGVAGTTGAAGTGGAVCAPVDVPVAGVKPDILVLLDASASMNRDLNDMACGTTSCGASSKWAQTTAAVNQVVATTDANVNWGLKYFADSGACGVSASVHVPIGPANAAAIANAIQGRTDAMGGVIGNSNTPTRAAEAAAAAYLATITDTSPKFILLATDGLPTCPASGGINGDDSIPAVGAVSDASGAGIATFVLGIGALSTGDTILSALADAGGRPRAASPSYYPVTSAGELTATLNQIVSIARVCRFPLTVPAGHSKDAIDVTGNGTVIPHDASHGNGWDYTDAAHTSIEIFGAPCDRVTDGTITRVSVTFRCPP